MRRHPYLKFMFVLLIGLVGVGYFRGWLSFSGNRETETKKVNVEVTVDPEKVKDDAAKMKDAASRVAKKAIGESSPASPAEGGTERR